MRQHLGEYEDYADSPELMGEDRADDYYRPHRRWPASLLTIGAMIVFAGGLWFAYVQGTRHPAATGSSGEGVPLLRADDRPTKVRPDQPGGMAVPDQNVSLYNEKPGGPPVEKLLPAPEQPMPRPAAPPKEATAPPPPIPAPPQTAPEPAAAAPAKPAAQAKPVPTAKETTAAKEAAAILGAAPSASPKAGGAVRVQLGALRSPEAARDEWARLKREQPELLGKLNAVSVRADLGDKGIFYRIQAGPLADAAAGERLCGELRQRKLGCALVR